MSRANPAIPTSHTGGLFRPADLPASGLSRLLQRSGSHEELAAPEMERRLAGAVVDVVQKQAESGLTIINDGEFGKGDFLTYVTERLSGLELVPSKQHWHRFKDWQQFPDYYDHNPLFQGPPPLNIGDSSYACVGPVSYTGRVALARDLRNLTEALRLTKGAQGFYPSIAPGMLVDIYPNQYYPTQDRYLYAYADALATEYEAIAQAGFILQIDTPDLAQNFSYRNFDDVPTYLRDVALRIESLNHALRNVPREQIRVHVCWGSWWGPHETDLPLEQFAHLLLDLKMGCLSIEAATVNHEADWHAWKGVRTPDDLILMPGVITHKTDSIESPRLVADRLLQYASIFGRDRVIAGTDCGMVRCPAQSIAWAKFKAMSQGARLAARELWGAGA
jgi:5-methyltetrahydropteroyltriglutamate--homocysteine methyltransferase